MRYSEIKCNKLYQVLKLYNVLQQIFNDNFVLTNFDPFKVQLQKS